MMQTRQWCLRIGAFLVAGLAAAHAAQFGDFGYESSGTAVTITSYTGPGGEVTIPDQIQGLPVTVIGWRALFLRPGLTSVTIPDSVTSIGGGAFRWCTGLTGAVIGNSVTSIGTTAFEG